MVTASTGHKRYFMIALIYFVVFLLVAELYSARQARIDQKSFRSHAVIIADDIWALDPTGAQTYLRLALDAYHYQSLTVSIPGNPAFAQVSGPEPKGLEGLLYNANIIRLKELKADIHHQDLLIGTLTGFQFVRVIFPILNIMMIFLLLLLLTFIMNYLLSHRKLLKQQVAERTLNLLESERKFEDLVNLLPEMVLETDLNGIIRYANKEAKTRFGLDASPDGRRFFDFIIEQDRQAAKHALDRSLRSDEPGLEEFSAIDHAGHPFPILIRSAPIVSGNQITGARSIVVDITERHRMEENLRRDQKMKAIGLMAGGVAHDLNNILSGIVSYPDLLLIDLDRGNPLRRPLEAIRKAGIEASSVVADLLTVARGIVVDHELVELNDLIYEYFDSPDFQQLRARNPLITFNVSFEPELLPTSCSRLHVRKCLMNLVTNGVEAIEGKGYLSISTRNSEGNTVAASSAILPEGGSFSVIRVADTGPGISAHEIDHIFEPFYSKKVMGRSGTGLGLTVVWNTMRDHGGAVGVSSSTAGTVFELYFPSVERADNQVSKVSEKVTNRGSGESVLIIDDEVTQREIASEMLNSLGYQVQSVSSGEEALAYLRLHAVDLLVLDMLLMPGKCNGRQTYESALQINPGQKAIIASGFAENEDVHLTMNLGAGAFVAKPYTLDQLGSAVYNVLNS